MKRLGVRYVGWFNRKYGRVGHPFQDRFRSRPVESDAYLYALVRYVWDNPVKAGLVARPEEYHWSSRRLLGQRSGLVDDGELERLMLDGGLAEIALQHSVAHTDEAHLSPGVAPRHTPEEVAELLQQACGPGAQDDFRSLPTSLRRRAIGELRTRGVRYAQIARATGMSTSGVLRLHVGRELRPVAPDQHD